MTLKWIGAVLIIVGCGGMGFRIALSYQRELRTMEQLVQLLDYMECELEFRMTPLPQLCAVTAKLIQGCLGQVLFHLAEELENQVSPDAGCCMNAAIAKVADIPASSKRILSMLGMSLGRFDLDGQLKEISAVREHCHLELDRLRSHRENRVRSCQTLGICAGVALAILFI